jgi:methionyl-tRNA formyltransferase
MKFVFFGGKESRFAQIFLDELKKGGLAPVAEMRDAKAPLDAEYLKSLGADFFLVASFAKILKKEIIEIPLKGTIGVHPSLLPKYRGASPIQSAILNDEKETGTTLFLIDEKVDHGPIINHKSLIINYKDNYLTLEEKLAKLSAKLAVETLPKYLAGEIQLKIQDESQATYTKKFKTEDAEVDWEKDNPRDVWLKIRALNPEPGAFTILNLKNGKQLRLKLLEAEYQDGELELKKVQPEGKKPMDYESFLNGYQRLLK